MTTVCSLEPFLYDTVPQPDDATGLQLAQEQLQDWLKRFLECVCADLSAGGGGGGATTFLGLTDTPSSYTGQAGLFVKVNPTEDGLIFSAVSVADDGDGRTLDHSTSEQTTPRTWFLANDTIYQKSVDYGAMPNATTKSVAHGITNLDKVVNIEFWMKRDSDGTQGTIPHINNTALGSAIQLTVDATNINTRTSANYSAWDGRLTIWYTRT